VNPLELAEVSENHTRAWTTRSVARLFEVLEREHSFTSSPESDPATMPLSFEQLQALDHGPPRDCEASFPSPLAMAASRQGLMENIV